MEFISRVFKQDLPNLKWLDMSYNPLLGAGVDNLIKHLSCAPHLKKLYLYCVKMTPQQVMDLSSAIKQHGNITDLLSSYHVSFPILSQFVSILCLQFISTQLLPFAIFLSLSFLYSTKPDIYFWKQITNFSRFKVSFQIHSFQLIKLNSKQCFNREQVN